MNANTAPRTGDMVMYYNDTDAWATVTAVTPPAWPGAHTVADVTGWSDGMDSAAYGTGELVVIPSRGGMPDAADTITFPASVRSDTYAVDYARILGPAWADRQTAMHVADQRHQMAAEAIRVAALFVDPRNTIHTDLLARPVC